MSHIPIKVILKLEDTSGNSGFFPCNKKFNKQIHYHATASDIQLSHLISEV
jgi:hypothetical protein